MDPDSRARKSSKTFLVSLIVIALVAVGGIGVYVAWANGAFQGREKIAILTWNQDPFWDPLRAGAQDAARDCNVDLTLIESEPTVEAQMRHLKDLVNGGAQAIAISPHNPREEEAAINEAADKVMIVTFDSDAPHLKRKGFIGTNDYAAGQVAGEQVREAIPDGGNVIISVGSIEMTNGRDRRQGVIDDLLDRPTKSERAFDLVDADLKGNRYSVVATVVDGGDPTIAIKQLADAIQAHPNVKCIVGLFSYSGPAILKAIDQAGKKGKIKIVGFDESAEEQAAVRSGEIYSSVLQDQYRCGYATVRTISDLLKGNEQNGPIRPSLTELPVLVMRPDNIDALRKDRIIRNVPTTENSKP